MSLVLKDRVKETTTTTGTGVLDLDGAKSGFEGFLSSVGDGNTCYYTIIDADNTAWEVGVGTVADSGTVTLSRDTILESSNSDQAISLTSGEHTVFLTYPAGKSVYRDTNDQIVATASGILFSDSSIQTTAASGYTAGTGISLVGNEFNIDSSVIQSGDNISVLVNDTGYLTSYSETGTLQTVTDNGATTNNAIIINENLTAETVFADLDGPVVIECKNITGSQIDNGTPIYVSGYFSGNGKALISPAIANNASTMPAIGVAGSDIAHDSEGHVHVFGQTTGFDTSSFTVGDLLYVSPTGGFTNVRPTGINELVQNMGRTLRSDASQGRVLLLGPGRSNDVPNSGDFTALTVEGVPVGFGDAVGPSSATDNALVRYDGTTGKLVQDSLVIIDDNGVIMVPDQSANPGSPGAGKHYIWVSDGTGDGFDGDLMLKTDDNTIWNLLKRGDGVASFLGMDGGAYPNTSTAIYSVVVGGRENDALAEASFVGGGRLNVANTSNSAIVGGQSNVISSGTHAFMGGGIGNACNAQYGVANGGQTNSVGTGSHGVIGGGRNNSTGTGTASTIAGGNNNSVGNAQYTSIGGGLSNSITATSYATICGGTANSVASDYGFIGGGFTNNIQAGSTYVSLPGGRENDIQGSYATIGGGHRNNIITGAQSTICGGADNTVNGTYSIIVGGNANTTSAQHYNIIVGGNSNEIAAGYHNMILGGFNNDMTTTNDYNIIVGGEANAISGVQEHAFIGGGTLNSIDGRAGYVGGGQNNDIINASSYGTIGGGANNEVNAEYGVVAGGDTNTAGHQAFVGGGVTNQALGRYSAVAAGINNKTNGLYGAICGGNGNITYNTSSFIGGGVQNVASGIESVVCGGDNNQSTALNSTIAGGRLNGARGNYSFIGGGENNDIIAGGDYSVICGGDQNTITKNPSDDCAILGGRENSIRNGISVTIGGGELNIGSGSYSSILGGRDNQALDSYTCVVGGQNNTAYFDHSTIAGGELNSASGDGSFIGGGHSNITTGIDSCVPGGLRNQANQDYSTALGIEAVTRNKGEITQSAGSFSSAGDSEIRRLHLRRQTTNATALSLTDDNAGDSAGSWNCAYKTLQSYEVVVIGHKDDDSEFAKYTFDGLIRRADASSPVSLDSNKTVNYESDAAWDCDISVGSGGVKINVTGAAATNINWTAKVVLTESTVA